MLNIILNFVWNAEQYAKNRELIVETVLLEIKWW